MHDWSPERIKAFRKNRNESQAVFAQHFGVDQSAVTLWEKGKSRPRGPILKLLEQMASQAQAA